MNSSQFGLSFHHMGLAVRDPSPTIVFLKAMGYQIGDAVFDPLQGVNLSLCLHSLMPAVELVWAGEGASPIDRIVRKGDGSIYHLCYTAKDAAASLDAMEREGIDIIEISPPTPARLFGGDKVSFHSIAGFGLIEILERDPAQADSFASIT